MIKVYSKIELNKNTKQKILDSLNIRYPDKGLKLDEIEFVIDKSIYSGIKINIDSEIIDLTLNNRLEKMLEILNNN